MASALTIVNSQNQRLEEEYKRLPITDKPFALVDFPNHENVGDSAIWLGELALLKRCFGRVPNYMCDIDNFSKELMDEKVPDGPILLSGGGNFGDIWPVHQSFREYIISAFPDRQIVQLPQSVKFNSSDGVIRFANLVKHHPTFTLLVRDSPSEKFAVQNFGCSVRLCPDSAFAIGPITSYVKRSSDLTLLMRTDIESKSISSNSYLSGVTLNLVDWMHESRFFIPTCNIASRLAHWGRNPHLNVAARNRFYYLLAAGRVRRGMKLLGSGRAVVTDRLHAHVLCILMDIPHVVIDNSYGKVYNYIDDWTSDYDYLQRAETLTEAMSII